MGKIEHIAEKMGLKKSDVISPKPILKRDNIKDTHKR
jgi:hypothetical protein